MRHARPEDLAPLELADVRPADGWERLRVDTPDQQRALLDLVAVATAAG